MSKKIIYAVYGSNLLKEKFMIYIKGGWYKGQKYRGCRDKTEPIDRGWIFIPYCLYFAKQFLRWGRKGVAFITCEENKNYQTLVRLWEITEEQFNKELGRIEKVSISEVRQKMSEFWQNKN